MDLTPALGGLAKIESLKWLIVYPTYINRGRDAAAVEYSLKKKII